MAYSCVMDIQRLSMDMATQRIADQVGAKVMGLAMDAAKGQSASLARLMEGSAPESVRDPALGSRIDLLA